MTTFTVKNIPADIYDLLKQSAVINRRSINSEIIVCIERAVSSQRLEPETALARAREIREMSASYRFSAAEIQQAKIKGRP